MINLWGSAKKDDFCLCCSCTLFHVHTCVNSQRQVLECWADCLISVGGYGSFWELHQFPSAYGNVQCCVALFHIFDPIASLQEWWTAVVTSGACSLSWCWASGLVPLAFWVSCSTFLLLSTPQLIPNSTVGFWLYTLAQELLSHLRCWENEGRAWSRFLHVPEPHTTVRQDIMWPLYPCWWTQGCAGYVSLASADIQINFSGNSSPLLQKLIGLH